MAKPQALLMAKPQALLMVKPQALLMAKPQALFIGKIMTERKVETILGPCSVHSRDQLRETVLSLNHGIVPDLQSIRANLDKPTSAYGWRGLQQSGVSIINEVKTETKCRISMEVTTARALEYMLLVSDDLWLGAKQQPNNTQEILYELQGVDLGMFLIKNPWAYDPSGWAKTIEEAKKRLKPNVRVAALFRGFKERSRFSDGGDEWRYNPDMDAVCEVIKETGVEAWIDYSHLIGETKLLYNYLMTHRLPKIFTGGMLEIDARDQEAMTDKKQVLTPEQGIAIVKHWREDNSKFKIGII